MPKSKVTLNEIAKIAGVSAASVSRVLRNPSQTSAKLQMRVNEVIRDLDIKYPEMAKPAKKNTKQKRLLVIDNQINIQSLIHYGLEKSARELGYKLLHLRFVHFKNQEMREFVTYISNYNVAGIVILNHAHYIDHLIKFKHMLPPFLLVNHFILNQPSLYFDNLSIAFKATQHLVQNGHKKIAIMLGDHNKISSHHFLTGYNQALDRGTIACNSHYILQNCINHDVTSYKFEKLMLQSNPPSALICADNLCSSYGDNLVEMLRHEEEDDLHDQGQIIHSVVEKARQINVQIPNQLSLLHIGYAKFFTFNSQLNFIDTLHKPIYQMGKKAVQLLHAIIQDDKSVRYSNIMEAELLIRNSVLKLN
ncbi:LacI family DNA-binding transcriptional regulator [Orbaceae bacterium ac157xtp]